MNLSMGSWLRRWSRFQIVACLMLASCSLGAPPGDQQASAFAGPPRIHIAAPLPEQVFMSGATVIVQARIENAGPDLAMVRVLLNDETLGEQAQPNPTGAAILPLTIDWRSGEAREYAITVIAERADGSQARETVNARVISDLPAPTEIAPVAEPAAPIASLPATVLKPANLRAGPGANFDLVANIPANQTLEINARDDAGLWYRTRHNDSDAWIYSDMLQLEGDASLLPGARTPARDDGWINLLIDDIILEPNPLVCDAPGKLTVIIRNEGTADTSGGGFIDIRDSSGNQEAVFQQVFGPVRAGGSVESQGADIRITAGAGTLHQLHVSIDNSEMIAETDEDDNNAKIEYRLARGDCA